MRNKAVDITWKFANKLRDKYSAERVVTALISFVYVIWQAREKKLINNDLLYLVEKADEAYKDHFDKEQYEVFHDSISLLKNELEGLFDDEFFKYVSKADENDLRVLIDFLVKKSGQIDRNFDDVTNEQISSIFANLLEEGDYQKILDPCVGSAQLFVELAKQGIINPSKVIIHGIEKISSASLIAHINLAINGFHNFSIITSDILIHEFKDESYDLIISDLPLGVKLRDRSFGGEEVPASWRFYHLLFTKSLKQLRNSGHAFFTSSVSIIRDLNRYSKNDQIELKIFDTPKSYIKKLSQIIDASGAASWSYTNIPLYILGYKNVISQDLEINKVEDLWESKKSITISKSVWFSFDHITDPSFFLTNTFQEIENRGKEDFLKLEDFFESGLTTNRENNLEKEEILFSLNSGILQNISGWKVIKEESLEQVKDIENVKSHTRIAKPGSWVLRPSNDGLQIAILLVDSPVLIPGIWGAIKPKDDLSELDKKWLRGEILSKFVKDQVNAIEGSIINRVSTNKLLEYILIPQKSEEEKENFINEWQEKRISDLEREQEKIKDSYQDVLRKEKKKKVSEDFNLIHDLHHTLKNDLSSIKGAVKSIENYLKEKEKSGNKVKLSEPIKQSRKGADPKLQVAVKERIESLKSVVSDLSNFVADFKTILSFDPERQDREWIELKSFFEKYGKNFDKFTLKVNEHIEELEEFEHRIFVDHFQLYTDREVFRLVFQNVIENAIQHGFNEDQKYNIQIDISEKGSIDEAFQYYNEIGVSKDWNFTDEDFKDSDYRLQILIKNDGDPLPPQIDEESYFTKGRGGSSRGSGTGGYHIKKGIESLGGRVSLLQPEEDDPFQVQILIEFPIQYVESPNLISLDSRTLPDFFEEK